MPANQLAVVTGASTGIGLELARCCADNRVSPRHRGQPARDRAGGSRSPRLGVGVEAVQADLATTEGVDKLYAAVSDRPIDALLANAAVGLGKAFLDQDFQRRPARRRHQHHWHALSDPSRQATTCSVASPGAS